MHLSDTESGARSQQNGNNSYTEKYVILLET